MTLAELLISAEIDPNELNGKVKYLAQDASSYTAYSYSEYPSLCNINDRYSGDLVLFTIDYPEQLASDWETPLSIESYTAAWNAAHNVNVKEEENIMCEDVKSEWPRLMQAIYKGHPELFLVVEFDNETLGKVIETNVCHKVGEWRANWQSCLDNNHWKPYVQVPQSPSAALPDVPVTLTAQDIVLRLEELKTGIKAMEAIKETLVKEYEELRDTLLTLI